jgi:hypothetical protein
LINSGKLKTASKGVSMAEVSRKKSNAFLESCDGIFARHPDAIGVAFKWLDCGCVLLCGVSARGEPVGALVHVSGSAPGKGRPAPICLKCKRDGGLDRVVWQGIHWPGDEGELPERRLRLAIGRQVFGTGYVE